MVPATLPPRFGSNVAAFTSGVCSHGSNSTLSLTSSPLPFGFLVAFFGPLASPHQFWRASTVADVLLSTPNVLPRNWL
ncbi:MAG: hypothetical protein HC853_02950 [Anaerolineae bacterium]|nr:hypothetical protein [Anaerolineae bacterium]